MTNSFALSAFMLKCYMHDLWNMCMCSKTKQITVQNCTKKKYEFESFFSSAVHFVRFCFNTSEVWVHLCTWIYFNFFVADRCHTPICRCDRNHILENILIVEKKNQQRKWTSVWVAQEILLPNVLHILEKLVPCKTYSSSIFHQRSKKKSLNTNWTERTIFLCRVTKTKYFRSTRL